jgi:hypothetical protein
MARLLGPGPQARLALHYTSSRQVEGVPGRIVTVWADEARTVPADIAAYDPDHPDTPGAVIPGGMLRVGRDSRLPLFWYPDGVDTVWAGTTADASWQLPADPEARIDALARAQTHNTVGRVNVRDYGATGSGTGDDRAAIQAAIDALPTAGGTVYLPAGLYRVTAPLVLRSNLVLIGDGDGPSLIQQAGADQDLLTGTALNRVVVEKLYLVGTGAGTGSGVNLVKGGNDATPYISMRDVTVESFGRDGVAVENPIVSSFDRVLAMSCGRYGMNLYGQAGGAAGTSSALSACYGNANGAAGIRLLNIVYATMFGCATDHNPIGYLIDGCQGVNLNGSGAEGNATEAVKINGGYGIALVGLWVYDNRGVGVHITGAANTVTVIGSTDNTPNASATNFIKVDAGCHVLLANCSNTSANSLASGTTNVAADAAGGAQFQGYTAILAGGEFDGDLTCYVAAKGIVLTDRNTAAQYRLKVAGGVLGVEAV